MEENGINYTFSPKVEEIVGRPVFGQEDYNELVQEEEAIMGCYPKAFQDYTHDIEEEFDILNSDMGNIERDLKRDVGLNGQLHHTSGAFHALEHILVLSGRKALAPLLRKILEKKQSSNLDSALMADLLRPLRP